MTTTTTEKTVTDTLATARQGADQIRQLGALGNDAGRAFGRLALETYEKAVATFLELEERAADAAPADWAKAAVSAHAGFVKDMNAAYVRTMHSIFD